MVAIFLGADEFVKVLFSINPGKLTLETEPIQSGIVLDAFLEFGLFMPLHS